MIMRGVLKWNFWIVATIFAAKELGELKEKLPGSVTTLDKNLNMLSELLTNPQIVIQWLLPALAAVLFSFYLNWQHTDSLVRKQQN